MAKKDNDSPDDSGNSENCEVSASLGHPLSSSGSKLKSDVVHRLEQAGIRDAEQLLAIAAIDEVYDHLAQQLGASKKELESILDEARQLVPPAITAEMAAPDPYEYGLGALPPPPGAEAVTALPSIELVAAPLSVNLIAKMPPIRNQASRGTCVAFTVTAMHDYIKRLAGGAPNNYSEQHIYYETKLIDGSSSACGTFQEKAAIALANRGQCLEAIWPYNPNEPCNNHGTRPANARPNGLLNRFQLVGGTGNASRNVAWIKNALATKRPVGISIPVYNSWYASAYTRKTGIFPLRQGTEPSVGGHAVCLVGYQDSSTAPGGGYFILRNSWGTAWASQSAYGSGYGTIPYQYITNENWEAYTPSSLTIDEDEPEVDPTDEDAVKPVKGGRTITIRIKGNVNLIIE